MISLSKLVDESAALNESIYDRGLFKAVFLSGLPGAGKTYTSERITDGQIAPRIVNFDKYAEFLGKKLGIKDVGGIVEKTFIDRTKRMNINQLALYVNGMLPLIVDSTSNKINRTVYRDGLLKSFGYDTAMVYVNTSFESAWKRIQQRDRSVPIEFVKAVHASLEENVEYYRSHFEIFVEVKNEEGELNDKAILKAYREVSSFFNDEIKNPIGRRNYEKAKASSGYLVPSAYRDINKVRSKFVNWY